LGGKWCGHAAREALEKVRALLLLQGDS